MGVPMTGSTMRTALAALAALAGWSGTASAQFIVPEEGQRNWSHEKCAGTTDDPCLIGWPLQMLELCADDPQATLWPHLRLTTTVPAGFRDGDRPGRDMLAEGAHAAIGGAPADAQLRQSAEELADVNIAGGWMNRMIADRAPAPGATIEVLIQAGRQAAALIDHADGRAVDGDLLAEARRDIPADWIDRLASAGRIARIPTDCPSFRAAVAVPTETADITGYWVNAYLARPASVADYQRDYLGFSDWFGVEACPLGAGQEGGAFAFDGAGTAHHVAFLPYDGNDPATGGRLVAHTYPYSVVAGQFTGLGLPTTETGTIVLRRPDFFFIDPHHPPYEPRRGVLGYVRCTHPLPLDELLQTVEILD